MNLKIGKHTYLLLISILCFAQHNNLTGSAVSEEIDKKSAGPGALIYRNSQHLVFLVGAWPGNHTRGAQCQFEVSTDGNPVCTIITTAGPEAAPREWSPVISYDVYFPKGANRGWFSATHEGYDIDRATIYNKDPLSSQSHCITAQEKKTVFISPSKLCVWMACMRLLTEHPHPWN
jgi:hypothetical protein